MKSLPDLGRRLGVSTIFVIFVALLIAFSQLAIMQVVITAVISLACAVALWEYSNLSFAKGIIISKKTMIVLGVLQIVGSYFYILFPDLYIVPQILIITAALVLFVAHFKDPSDSLSNVATGFFGICYIAIPLSFMLQILYVDHGQDGRWWLAYLIVVTKITDVGAYFVGRLWGKRRLAPVLSPKKTIEGAVGGLILAIIFSVCAKLFFLEGFQMSMLSAVLLGAALGIFGQIGDLAESLFKRDASFKDSNKLPGLGGVLDLLDSLLFTTPLVYLFLKL